MRPATLLKKGLQYSCFPVSFAIFLRTPMQMGASYDKYSKRFRTVSNINDGLFGKIVKGILGVNHFRNKLSRNVLKMALYSLLLTVE